MDKQPRPDKQPGPDEQPRAKNAYSQGGGSGAGQPETALFSPKKPARDEMPINIWAIAVLVVLVVAGAFLVLGRHNPAAAQHGVLPLDAYAQNLPLAQIAMSESTSLSGGKSTFVDGHVANTGERTISSVTVQVLFHNAEAMPPLVETLPLTLIRTREPYVDTQPVGSAPLKPGDDREFRLIFETLPSNWNGQIPEIHVVHVMDK